MLSGSRTRRWTLRTGFVLGLFLWFAPVAIAKYRPPKTPSTPSGTGTNTTRGGSCDENDRSIGLTPIAPLSHVGQTTSVRPTFVWFVVDRVPHRLEFRLFTRTGQPLYRTQLQSQPGIMSITLPPDQPGLAIGQSYVWQVVLMCSANVRLIETADITVVKPPSTLRSQLAIAQTPQQRIDLYAESGLWYDALAEARKSPQNQSAMLNLIDSLANSEARSKREWSGSFGVALRAKRLKQIETIERQHQAEP